MVFQRFRPPNDSYFYQDTNDYVPFGDCPPGLFQQPGLPFRGGQPGLFHPPGLPFRGGQPGLFQPSGVPFRGGQPGLLPQRGFPVRMGQPPRAYKQEQVDSRVTQKGPVVRHMLLKELLQKQFKLSSLRAEMVKLVAGQNDIMQQTGVVNSNLPGLTDIETALASLTEEVQELMKAYCAPPDEQIDGPEKKLDKKPPIMEQKPLVIEKSEGSADSQKAKGKLSQQEQVTPVAVIPGDKLNHPSANMSYDQRGGNSHGRANVDRTDSCFNSKVGGRKSQATDHKHQRGYSKSSYKQRSSSSRANWKSSSDRHPRLDWTSSHGRHLRDDRDSSHDSHPRDDRKSSHGRHSRDDRKSSRGRHSRDDRDSSHDSNPRDDRKSSRGRHSRDDRKSSRGRHSRDDRDSSHDSNPRDDRKSSRGRHSHDDRKSSRGRHSRDDRDSSHDSNPRDDRKSSRGRHSHDDQKSSRGRHSRDDQDSSHDSNPRDDRKSSRGRHSRDDRDSSHDSNPCDDRKSSRGRHSRDGRDSSHDSHPRDDQNSSCNGHSCNGDGQKNTKQKDDDLEAGKLARENMDALLQDDEFKHILFAFAGISKETATLEQLLKTTDEKDSHSCNGDAQKITKQKDDGREAGTLARENMDALLQDDELKHILFAFAGISKETAKLEQLLKTTGEKDSHSCNGDGQKNTKEKDDDREAGKLAKENMDALLQDDELKHILFAFAGISKETAKLEQLMKTTGEKFENYATTDGSTSRHKAVQTSSAEGPQKPESVLKQKTEEERVDVESKVGTESQVSSDSFSKLSAFWKPSFKPVGALSQLKSYNDIGDDDDPGDSHGQASVDSTVSSSNSKAGDRISPAKDDADPKHQRGYSKSSDKQRSSSSPDDQKNFHYGHPPQNLVSSRDSYPHDDPTSFHGSHSQGRELMSSLKKKPGERVDAESKTSSVPAGKGKGKDRAFPDTGRIKQSASFLWHSEQFAQDDRAALFSHKQEKTRFDSLIQEVRAKLQKRSGCGRSASPDVFNAEASSQAENGIDVSPEHDGGRTGLGSHEIRSERPLKDSHKNEMSGMGFSKIIEQLGTISYAKRAERRQRSFSRESNAASPPHSQVLLDEAWKSKNMPHGGHEKSIMLSDERVGDEPNSFNSDDSKSTKAAAFFTTMLCSEWEKVFSSGCKSWKLPLQSGLSHVEDLPVTSRTIHSDDDEPYIECRKVILDSKSDVRIVSRSPVFRMSQSPETKVPRKRPASPPFFPVSKERRVFSGKEGHSDLQSHLMRSLEKNAPEMCQALGLDVDSFYKSPLSDFVGWIE